MAPARLSVIVCAYNEAATVGPCLHSVLAQTRLPDEIILVDNASTDETAIVAERIPGVRVVHEPCKGLPRARETGRLAATGDILLFLDADCRAPLHWVERVAQRFDTRPDLLGVTGPYRYYDWDLASRALLRAYDTILAPFTQVMARHVLRVGSLLYGGNFAVRRDALSRIGGFDITIAFHGEDTNVGRRLGTIGPVHLAMDCYLHTSARRYRAMGRLTVFRLYIRNFLAEMLQQRPRDTAYVDVRH